MASEYKVIEHVVTPGTCKVMAQLVLSALPGAEQGPIHRILKKAGTTTCDLKYDFDVGTVFQVKGEHPVINGKVYENLVLR